MQLIPNFPRRIWTLFISVGLSCAVWGAQNNDHPALSEQSASALPVVETETVTAVECVVAEPDTLRHWYIKTSIPAWIAAVVNVSGEYRFDNNFSVALSLRYSAWNYGHVDCKFRTFRFQPEVRYWFDNSHTGWFVEAHLAMISYNVALPSWNYRIQDRKGKHPALGGGVGAGYRVPFKPGSNWSFEAQLGLGVYHLDYNRWENKRGGQLVDRKVRTFCGIDNVALSIVYNFNNPSRR